MLIKSVSVNNNEDTVEIVLANGSCIIVDARFNCANFHPDADDMTHHYSLIAPMGGQEADGFPEGQKPYLYVR